LQVDPGFLISQGKFSAARGVQLVAVDLPGDGAFFGWPGLLVARARNARRKRIPNTPLLAAEFIVIRHILSPIHSDHADRGVKESGCAKRFSVMRLQPCTYDVGRSLGMV